MNFVVGISKLWGDLRSADLVLRSRRLRSLQPEGSRPKERERERDFFFDSDRYRRGWEVWVPGYGGVVLSSSGGWPCGFNTDEGLSHTGYLKVAPEMQGIRSCTEALKHSLSQFRNSRFWGQAQNF